MAFWGKDVIFRYKKGILTKVSVLNKGYIMKKEIKESLKEEINLIKQRRLKVITGIILLGLDVILFVVRKQIFEFRIAQMLLMINRYLIDDEYSEEVDNKNQ